MFQINSIFGKCLENVKLYHDVKLITCKEFAQKWANKSRLKSYTKISDDIVCVDLIKERIKLCKPIYTGMVCVLCTVLFIILCSLQVYSYLEF